MRIGGFFGKGDENFTANGGFEEILAFLFYFGLFF